MQDQGTKYVQTKADDSQTGSNINSLKQAGDDKKIEKNIDLNHELKNNSSIWFANQNSYASKQQLAALATGFEALDSLFQIGGWPAFGTIELGLSQHGIGELRLLSPALRALLKQKLSKQIVLINPPFLPYAPALLKEGLDPARTLIIKTHSMTDTLWTSEQALHSGSCAAVLAWTNEHDLSHKESRRLQLASKSRQTWHVLLRHGQCLQQSSAASLRLSLSNNHFGQLTLKIVKQLNGWGGQKCTLSLHPHYENWQRIPVELLPVRNQKRITSIENKIPNFGDSHHKQAKVTVLTPLSSLTSVH